MPDDATVTAVAGERAPREAPPARSAPTGLEAVAWRVLRWVIHRLRSAPKQGLAESVELQAQSYDRALVVVRAFYALSLVWTVQQMNTWPDLLDAATIAPPWPAAWLDVNAPRSGIAVILIGFTAASVLAAMWPRVRTFRLLYAVGLLEMMAVKNGFGKINHDYHGWLWTAMVLVVLPVGSRLRKPDARTRQQVLAVLWSAQVLLLFFYTLTGLWKLAYAVDGLSSTRISSLQIDGFSLIIADRLLGTNQHTLLGEFLVRNPVIGWALFNGTMYLETCSLIVAFRPRLHRLWGGGLIAFHIGTMVAMGFTFLPNIVLLGLLFLCSPWAPDRISVPDMLLDLPGVHLVANAVRRWRGRSTEVRPAPAA